MIKCDSWLSHVFDNYEREEKGFHGEIALIIRQQNKKLLENDRNYLVKRGLSPLPSLNPGLNEVLLIPYAV